MFPIPPLEFIMCSANVNIGAQTSHATQYRVFTIATNGSTVSRLLSDREQFVGGPSNNIRTSSSIHLHRSALRRYLLNLTSIPPRIHPWPRGRRVCGLGGLAPVRAVAFIPDRGGRGGCVTAAARAARRRPGCAQPGGHRAVGRSRLASAPATRSNRLRWRRADDCCQSCTN